MRNALTVVVNGWAMLGGLCLGVIIVLTAINVGAVAADMGLRGWGIRVQGIYGYEDAVRLLASVAALSFFPICQLRKGHVAVGLIIDNTPPALQRANLVLANGLTCALAVFLTYWIFIGALEVRRDGLTTAILEWPQWPFYWPGVVSTALWAIVAGVMTVDAVSNREVHHGSS